MNANNPELNPSTNPDTSNTWDQLCDEAQKSISWDQLANPTPETTLPDLPTTSTNETCNYYLRLIERQGDMNNVKNFLESAINRNYHSFSSKDELNSYSKTYSDQLASSLNYEDTAALKHYTGLNSEIINQVSRGYWNYDILGPQTPEKVNDAEQMIEQISHTISQSPNSEINLTSYRGTNLNNFREYDIHSISDLNSLKNQFFLETGFTSTSLSPANSFAKNKPKNSIHGNHNIEIEYLIPEETRETIGPLDDRFSHYPEEYELLIDKDSLSYISNVEISPDASSAKLQMILIPRQVYDPATR